MASLKIKAKIAIESANAPPPAEIKMQLLRPGALKPTLYRGAEGLMTPPDDLDDPNRNVSPPTKQRETAPVPPGRLAGAGV